MKNKFSLITMVRFLLSFILPPVVGTCILYVARGEMGGWRGIPAMIVWGVVFVGIQAIVYTIVMEFLGISWVQNQNVPQKRKYVLCGILLGGLSGLTLLASLGLKRTNTIFILIGLLTGFIVTCIKLKLHLMQREICKI